MCYLCYTEPFRVKNVCNTYKSYLLCIEITYNEVISWHFLIVFIKVYQNQAINNKAIYIKYEIVYVAALFKRNNWKMVKTPS